MTEAQKEKIVTMKGNKLMELFISYHDHYDMDDELGCEIYYALQKEILERLHVYDHI